MRLKKVLFDSLCSFLGRNGCFGAKGLEVSVIRGNYISIEPITSRGSIGRCWIEVPIAQARALSDAVHHVCGITATRKQINRAREVYSSDDVMIDDTAVISKGEDGTWVAAWVFLPKEAA